MKDNLLLLDNVFKKTQHYKRICDKSGLKLEEAYILCFLFNEPDYMSSKSNIMSSIYLNSSLDMLFKKLIYKNLIIKKRSLLDERQIYIYLTQEGINLISDLRLYDEK